MTQELSAIALRQPPAFPDPARPKGRPEHVSGDGAFSVKASPDTMPMPTGPRPGHDLVGLKPWNRKPQHGRGCGQVQPVEDALCQRIAGCDFVALPFGWRAGPTHRSATWCRPLATGAIRTSWWYGGRQRAWPSVRRAPPACQSAGLGQTALDSEVISIPEPPGSALSAVTSDLAARRSPRSGGSSRTERHRHRLRSTL